MSEPQYPGAVAPERQRFFATDGVRLRVDEWGDPSATPVVLLHGAFDHGRGFDLLAPLLAERFHVLALTSRGHGDSEWVDSYAWPNDVADAVNLPGAGLVPLTSILLDRNRLIGRCQGR